MTLSTVTYGFSAWGAEHVMTEPLNDEDEHLLRAMVVGLEPEVLHQRSDKVDPYRSATCPQIASSARPTFTETYALVQERNALKGPEDKLCKRKCKGGDLHLCKGRCSKLCSLPLNHSGSCTCNGHDWRRSVAEMHGNDGPFAQDRGMSQRIRKHRHFFGRTISRKPDDPDQSELVVSCEISGPAGFDIIRNEAVNLSANLIADLKQCGWLRREILAPRGANTEDDVDPAPLFFARGSGLYHQWLSLYIDRDHPSLLHCIYEDCGALWIASQHCGSLHCQT